MATQYIRKYTINIAIPWEGEQDILSPKGSISRWAEAKAKDESSSETKTLESLQKLRRKKIETTGYRWQAFSQGGNVDPSEVPVDDIQGQQKYGQPFRDGVGKIYTFSDLHIEFEVKGGSDDLADGGDCEIVVYNMATDISKALQWTSGTQPLIKLQAGYEENFGEIFLGEIVKVREEFDDVNKKTILTCKKGGPAIRDMFTTTFYKKGTPLSVVLEELTSDLGLSISYPAFFIDQFSLKSDLYVHGKTKDTLKKVMDRYEIQATIIGTVVQYTTIFPTFEEIQRLYVISEDSGMVGKPSIIKEGSEDLVVNENMASLEENGGIQFTMLLNPQLQPQKYVELNTRDYSGVVRLVEVAHEGSYEGNDWYTVCKAEAVNDLTFTKIEDPILQSIAERRLAEGG